MPSKTSTDATAPARKKDATYPVYNGSPPAEVVAARSARPRRQHMPASTNSVIRRGPNFQAQVEQFDEPVDKRYDLCLRHKQMGTILSLEDSVGELLATTTAAPPKKFRADCTILVGSH